MSASRAREGGVGREERKEKEEWKGKEGVPSYDASVQGHTKRGSPAMTKASRDSQEGEERKEKEKRGREKETETERKREKRKRRKEKEVNRCSQLRASVVSRDTPGGEVYLSVTFRNTKKAEKEEGKGKKGGIKVPTGSTDP